MTRLSFQLVAALFLGVAVVAQDMAPPPPAAELKKFEAFVGHWEGSGTAMMAPGAPMSKWTSQSTVEWVLGRHWVQSDTTIKFEGQPFTLQFREYLGWDGENKRYVQITISNKGEGDVDTLHFVGDDQFVIMKQVHNAGKPVAQRMWSRYGKDSTEFVLTFLGADGNSSDAVKGTTKRVAKAKPDPLEVAVAMKEHPAVVASMAPMKKMLRMCGRYDVKGEVKFMPEVPAMKIEGTDDVRGLMDGTVVQIVTHGSPGNYQAHSYTTWDATASNYRMIVVDSMGTLANLQAWFGGDNDCQLRLINAGLHRGMPTASRMVMELDAAGRPTKVINHSCCGDSAPTQDFTATYTPAKK